MPNSLIDPVCVPDIFASELTMVEDLGGVVRFTFATFHRGEKVAVARIVLLASAVQDARRKTAQTMSQAIGPKSLCVCPLQASH